MKKKLLKTGIISLVITIVLMIINLISANVFHTMPLSVTFPGGECTEYIGLGVIFLVIYPMTDGTGPSIIYRVGFDFPSFIITFIILFVLIFLIGFIIGKIKKKGNK